MLFEILAVGAVALGIAGVKDAFKDEESTQKTIDGTINGLNRIAKYGARQAERNYSKGKMSEKDYDDFMARKERFDDFYEGYNSRDEY